MEEKVILITTKRELKEALTEMFPQTKKEPSLETKDRLSRREAARFLDISYQTMYNWIKAGLIKEHGFAKSKFFLRAELIEAMKNETKK